MELFGHLRTWDHLIVASDRNLLTGKRVSGHAGFHPVSVNDHSSNGWRRVFSWLTYAVKATAFGLRQAGVDAVYGSSPHLLAPLAGLIIAKIKGIPFVLEVRDLWPQVLVDMGQLSEGSGLHRLLTSLENLLYRRAALIVVLATGARDELVSRGIPSSQIVYLPNGADPEDFRPSAPREQLRETYGFTRFTAVYAGAHGPANGLELLLEAASSAADLPIDIVLVGGGVSKDRLVQLSRELDLKNVRFMDPIPKTEMPDILSAADLGLHILADVKLFQSSVSPNKLFDYMAAGLPVLTNSPGVVADIVESSRCGIACSPNELVTGLRLALLLDAGQCARAGQGWIRDNHSRKIMATRLELALGNLNATKA